MLAQIRELRQYLFTVGNFIYESDVHLNSPDDLKYLVYSLQLYNNGIFDTSSIICI